MKTVNFIEAVNSGKRFRMVTSSGAVSESFYWVADHGDVLRGDKETGDSQWANIRLIDAQFELEEKEITITESKFYKIIEELNCKNSHKSFACDVSDLVKELGF